MANIEYWIAVDRQKIGPMTLAQMRTRMIEPHTLVWREGLPTWVRADSLPELASIFRAQSIEECPSPVTSSESAPPVSPAEVDPTVGPRPYIAPVADARACARSRDVSGSANEVPQMPPTYVGWSIVALLLCCMIPAIVALVNALRVSSLYNSGLFEESRKASGRAELWLIISIVLGLVTLPFFIVGSIF